MAQSSVAERCLCRGLGHFTASSRPEHRSPPTLRRHARKGRRHSGPKVPHVDLRRLPKLQKRSFFPDGFYPNYLRGSLGT